MAKKPNLGNPQQGLARQGSLDLAWFEIQALELTLKKKKDSLVQLAILYKKEGIVSKQFNVVDSSRIDAKATTVLLKTLHYKVKDYSKQYWKFNNAMAKGLLGDECPMKVSQYLQKKKTVDLSC